MSVWIIKFYENALLTLCGAPFISLPMLQCSNSGKRFDRLTPM